MVKIGINGFGRIGRIALRVILKHYTDKVEVGAINTSGSIEAGGWAHLLEYDSVYGRLDYDVSASEEKINIGGKNYPLLAQREPDKIPWLEHGVEVVLEATGVFRDKDSASAHLDAGAEKVIITAPAKGDGVPIYVIGVNDDQYQGEDIISAGSCTTNCVAPIARVILDNFEIEEAMMTTIHAYTSTQELVDGSHQDLRRARAAAQNIVPTTSGAAEAVIEVLPSLKGRFAATAIRVPIICGSYSDLTFKFVKKTVTEEVNQVLEEAAQDRPDILLFSQKPLVSTDIIKTTHSAIIDSQMTKVVSDDLVQIAAWYDNEWAYCCRLIEEAIMVSEKKDG